MNLQERLTASITVGEKKKSIAELKTNINYPLQQYDFKAKVNKSNAHSAL